MGITGLLPYLEKKQASRVCSVKEFAGCTVAADAYCWLHKGAFACAEKLARGEPTDMYVQYCMKYVNMLLSHNIKPIMVFDGRHLPAKAQTEKKRRAKRQENKAQAAALLRQGRSAEARTFLQRCIDVTHAMALAVMKECHKLDVDCIVAPHEADAQLAFFSLEGIADLVITEDSDLLLFGCKKVMFKLDLVGNGILVEEEKLKLCMGIRPENYSFDKFRYMCILSGCDYLDSLPGIGLTKACQFITRTQDPDIHRALSRLPYQLNMRGLSVSLEYRDEFLRADAMFRHQLVFDPRTRKVKPLTPFTKVDPSSPLAGGPLPGCKPELEDSVAYQLALGNIDPSTLEQMHSFDPDETKPEDPKKKYYGQSPAERKRSIWSETFYTAEKKKPAVKPSFMEVNSRPVESTNGKSKSLNVDILLKRKRPTDENVCSDGPNEKRQAIQESKMLSIYTSPMEESKRCAAVSSPGAVAPSPTEEKPSPEKSPSDGQTSPILTPKRKVTNPFAQRSSSESNKNLGNKLFSMLHAPRPGVSIVQSRYFINKSSKEESLTSPKEELKVSPLKKEPVMSPHENPFIKPDQAYVKASPAVSSPVVSPVSADKDLGEEISLSPAKSTVTIENNTVITTSESKTPQNSFISTLSQRVNERKALVKSPLAKDTKPIKSPQGQQSKNSKLFFQISPGPTLGAGVKQQGLLSRFGFVAKAKLTKS